MLAGVSKRKVTQPTWVPYLTSSGDGTYAPFSGVHDELHVRALVLDDGDQSVAILAMDSIGYDNSILGRDRDFTSEIRARVLEATGIRQEALMLSATHAHSTPETIGLTPFRDVPNVFGWLEAHVDDLVETVVNAWNRRTPARFYFGSRRVSGVSRNRRLLQRDGSMSRRENQPGPPI